MQTMIGYARTAAFFGGIAALALVFLVLFSPPGGAFGSLGSWLRPDTKTLLISATAGAACVYAVRVWVAAWLGWKRRDTEVVVAVLCIFIGASAGASASPCDVFIWCDARHTADPRLDGCTASPGPRGYEVDC